MGSLGSGVAPKDLEAPDPQPQAGRLVNHPRSAGLPLCARDQVGRWQEARELPASPREIAEPPARTLHPWECCPPPHRSRLLATSHCWPGTGHTPRCLKIGGMTFLKVAPATSHPIGSTGLSPWVPILAPLEPLPPGRPPGFPLLPLTPARRRPGSSCGTAYDRAIKQCSEAQG